MDLYRRLARPCLFRLPPDTAHDLALRALAWPAPWRLVGRGPYRDPRLATDLCGIPLANPVGLAPGLDKDGDALAGLMHLGFGFLAPGAIMREARPGNPRPRLGRLVEQEALLNCMGLPSKGRAHAIAHLQRLKERTVPIVAELQGVSPAEIVKTAAALQPHADATAVGLECPNTTAAERESVLAGVLDLVYRLGEVRTRPLFAKVPNHFRLERPDRLPAFLDACIDAGLDGVIASGTGRAVAPQLSLGQGTISGRPVFQATRDLVRAIADHAGDRLAIVASGGVSTGRDAYEMLRAGASAVMILSVLIYRGPLAPRLINQELLAVLQAEGVPSVRALGARRQAAPAIPSV
jgi:dihydroorotate dehydrogenase